jgi:cyclophilin family peptidyl-prolyl cis-trans isomerase
MKQSIASLGALALFISFCGYRQVSFASDQSAKSPLMNPRDKHWSERAPETFKARFETSKGAFTIECHRGWAPRGVDRFYNLIRAGFFDNSRFFRLRAGFIAQFGIPGDPSVAAVWRNEAIKDDPVKESNTRGTIAYAMTGPDTRTTQLYINLSDNSRLDADGFAPLGKVIDGMEVVDKLYAGYGEEAGGGMRGGKQGKMFEGGNEYLDREFPKLDRIVRARLVDR